MAAAAEYELTLALVSLECDVFKISTTEARASGFITTLLRDMIPSELELPIPLPTSPSKYLAIVVEYLKQNALEPFLRIRKPILRGDLGRSFVPGWAEALLEPLTDKELLELHEAAGVLQIFMLEMASAAFVAFRWKMLSEAECLAKAGLDKPLTNEEEDCIRAENTWAFEDTDEEILTDPNFASVPPENMLGLK
jgi:hypothetical protein